MRQIRVNQFAILSDDAPNGEIPVEFGVQFKTDTVGKWIAVAFKTQYMNGSAPMLLLEIQCDFQVKPEDWDSLVNDGKLVFPIEFLRHIALHTVGSARGILFCKTEGSPFSRFILPPVNLETMISQDLEIPLPE
ncbi:MAG: hypothetical protein II859_10325 [Bacteroidales bacterium]|nr:hypothetical protein [Bacteroidales bacterium]